MKVVLDGNPILRQKAKEVSVADLKKGLYKGLVSDMQAKLAECHDGVALAAPQVGESLRLFVVSPKIFEAKEASTESATATTPARSYAWLKNDSSSAKNNLVYFNPVIKKLSSTKKDLDEGCLSVNELYGKVPRATKALIEAYDEYGMKFTRGASGLLAQIFQHEVDHLDGILYIDKASELKKLESRKTNV